jgi:uncharacterized protein (TIGR03437 family)
MHRLTLMNPQGQHTVNIMLEPAVPTLFNTKGYAAALHANYQPVSAQNPAKIGEPISLFATGLGAVTIRNGLQVANIAPTVLIGGQPAAVSFAGRAPGYQGLDQINVQVPAGAQEMFDAGAYANGKSVTVVVTSGSRTSNQVLLVVN